MKLENLESLIGEKLTIGFGRDNNRVVILYGKKGATIYGSTQGLSYGDIENIKILITPRDVECEEVGAIKNKIIFFKLGQHRFLSISYCNKDDLHIVYLPDESDLEYNKSQFMSKCSMRGLI